MTDSPLLETRRALFLSPHSDDAALSCGGTIARLCRGGREVLILTVCAGFPPPPPLSGLAEAFHASMGPAADLMAARRAEDRLAAEVLGCRCIQLDVPDAIYRRSDSAWFYETLPALFGVPRESDVSLTRAVVRQLEDLLDEETALVAPLGLGGHVDHRLTRQAAEDTGWPLLYYEEFPYGDPAYPGLPGVESVHVHPPNEDFTGGLDPALQPFDGVDLDRKIEACAQFGTQLPLVFRSAGELAERLSQFSHRHGLPDPAERIWAPSSAPAGPPSSWARFKGDSGVTLS